MRIDLDAAKKARKKLQRAQRKANRAGRVLKQEPAQKAHQATDAFLQTYEWRRVRMEALKKYGARCMCCGASPADGAVMNVDHIKPRKLFPWLALDLNNLQILCGPCNHGKGNWDMTDWRPQQTASDEVNAEALAHIRSL